MVELRTENKRRGELAHKRGADFQVANGFLKKTVILAAVAGLVGMGPAHAGPTEQALLASYIGNWSGESTLQGGDKPESFRCRLAVSQGNQSKINYTGRCTLVNMNLSVSGTVGYVDSAKRYEAVMSSNAGFSGLEAGRQQGNRISFNLQERQRDDGGNDVKIGTNLTLDNGTIIVEFQVEFNESGQVLTAKVPFSK